MAMTADIRAALSRRLAALAADSGGRQPQASDPGVLNLGCEDIDRMLPGGGLRRGALHEILGPAPGGDRRGDGAAMGFVAALLGRAMQADGVLRPAVWCLNRRVQDQGGLPGRPYAPGLTAFGVAVERLLFLYCPDNAVVLWAAEEALRSAAAVAVVTELDRLEPLAARRLQLAAAAAAATVLAIRPGHAISTSGFADSRWRLQTIAAGGDRAVYWRAEVLRCRGLGNRPVWRLGWRHGRLQAEPWAGETSAGIVARPLVAAKTG